MNPPSHERPTRPAWMLVLFGIAAVIGLLNIGLFLYGLTLPDEWSAAESVVIAAPAEEIYPFVASPGHWPEWTTWNTVHDPSLELEYAGPESGKGASFSWIGEQFGRGRLTIIDVQPHELVRYKLEMQGETYTENGRIRLEPYEGSTRVTWSDGGELGSTLGRFFRKRFETSVAADFAASLNRLKVLVEEREADSPATDEKSEDER